MTVEDTIARQQAANKKLRNMAKADPKPRKKPIRFKQDDVNRIVRGVLDDLAREIRHQVKETPAWGRALHWAAAKLDATPSAAPGAPGQEAQSPELTTGAMGDNTGAAAVQAMAEPTPEMVKRMVVAWLSQPPGLPWDDCAIAAWKAGVAALPAGAGSEREWLKCDACGKDMRGHDRMGHCGAGAREKTS